ncbi:hypothetical protein WJX77_010737 [Trebouxia sp. C0004]
MCHPPYPIDYEHPPIASTNRDSKKEVRTPNNKPTIKSPPMTLQNPDPRITFLDPAQPALPPPLSALHPPDTPPYGTQPTQPAPPTPQPPIPAYSQSVHVTNPPIHHYPSYATTQPLPYDSPQPTDPLPHSPSILPTPDTPCPHDLSPTPPLASNPARPPTTTIRTRPTTTPPHTRTTYHLPPDSNTSPKASNNQSPGP